MTDYKLLVSDDPVGLGDQVREFLLAGYVLYGSPGVSIAIGATIYRRYIQAVVK